MFTTQVTDHVATVTMSSAPVNALSVAWLSGLELAVGELTDREDWKVLRLRSDQKAFCAGADLNEMRERFEAPDGPDRSFAYVASIQRIYARIEALPQVTLAEIGGAALGGGLELALACDLRIAAQDVTLGLPEVGLGLIPGAGGTQRLTRLVGRGLAARLILGAETLDGRQAERLGIVQWSCERAALQGMASDIAGRIAALPAAALKGAKRCIAAALDGGRGGFGDELEITRELQRDPDTRRLVSAFLINRGKPRRASEGGPNGF